MAEDAVEPSKERPVATAGEAESDEAVGAEKTEVSEAWYRNPAVIVAGVVVLVVLLALLVLGLRSGSDDTPVDDQSSGVATTGDARLDRALELHFQGQTDEAAVIYRQILEVNPANQYAAYNLGLIAQTEGRLGEAVEFYNRSLSADPRFFNAAYNRGLAQRDLGQPELAITSFQEILANRDEYTDEQVAKVLINLGNILIAEGDAEAGEALVREATELDPSLRGDG